MPACARCGAEIGLYDHCAVCGAPAPARLREGPVRALVAKPPAPPDRRPAPEGWRRAVAALIDLGTVAIYEILIAGPVFLVVQVGPGENLYQGGGAGAWAMRAVLVLVSVVVPVVIAGVYELSSGQTPGKRFSKLRVVSDTPGHDGLTVAAAVVRSLVRLLSIAALGLGYVAARGDQQQRTWHDRASGTRVVDEAAPPPRQEPTTFLGAGPATRRRR